ncbi:Ig-like domain-containing protein [Pelagicoccus sp. SDUM812005]|uniref:Ig-like domain-containing protein n=1 Tax=Pelagicoccus sp. SDUM812005 TaxID=3041257 RepID=UPI00280C8A9F|nr:Ig-like domain-containing protein [Pelagicoccus sp. SDUM812005]MDQ8180285.1 Ig-like domain-containing protein [Pelagicoccus sp. SDUM812005]
MKYKKLCETIIACFALSGGALQAADYYVATTGSDSNAGTLESPFATIQRAVDQLGPGDTCFIRGGVYRGQTIDLSGVAGAEGSPITVTAYPGESVTVDGTFEVASEWTLDTGNVYKTTVAEPVTQLFVDDRLMTLARFPNAPVFSDTCWTKGPARIRKDPGSTNGTVIDAQLASLGIDFTDCVGVLNFGNHSTFARLVENHGVGSDRFNYRKVGKYKGSHEYFFEGGLNNAERVLLDTAEEWGYDESTGTLYLWADDGESPNGRQIFAKGTNAYSLLGDAGTHDIVVDGIEFFATTFYFASSDNITLQNCEFNYYAASKRSLGDTDVPQTAFFEGTEADFCVNTTIYNCAFRYADASGLWGNFVENMLVENNLFYHIDHATVSPDTGTPYFLHSQGTITVSRSRDFVYRRNTIDTAGSAQGVKFILYDPEEGRPWTSEYNFHTGCGKMEGSDSSSMYSPLAHVIESVGRYNWFIGNRRDFRWDGNNKPLEGVRANLYRNVALSTYIKGIAGPGDAYYLKGDFHEVYNNIGIGGAQSELAVTVSLGGNAHTLTRNNAADMIKDDPLPGVSSHNYVGQNDSTAIMATLLRDPANWDFRPRPDAVALIDQGTPTVCTVNGQEIDVTAGYLGAAPDIGAYEYGDDEYWIGGRKEPHASMAVPPVGRENIKVDADLMWLGGLDAVSHNVYFGTSPDNLVFQGNQTNNIFDPGILTNDQTYYWRVDAVQADASVIEGEVWNFTVYDHTPRPTSSRVVLLEDSPADIVLTGSDPDGDPLTFEISVEPEHGTLSGTAPNLVYTPDPNFFGEDRLGFKVSDGQNVSRSGTILLNVELVNDDAPVFVSNPIQGLEAVIGTPYEGTLEGAALDADEDPVSYAILSGPSWLSAQADGTLSGTPQAADAGLNSWLVEASDGTGRSATATLEIAVSTWEDSLLLSWEFDDASGSTVSDSGPSGHDGLASEGTWVAGISGSAMAFDGSATSVDIPAEAFSSVGEQITIALWIYGDLSQPRPDSIFIAFDGAGNKMMSLALPDNKNNVIWDAGKIGAKTYDRLFKNTPAAKTRGQWNHWVFTKNAATGEMAMYANGALHHSKTGTTKTLEGVADAYLGSNGINLYYKGLIDSVRIYGLSLDADAVADLYSSYATNNKIPYAESQSVSTLEDTSVALTLSGSDSDEEPLSYSVQTPPANGSLSGVAPDLVYTPDPDFVGVDSFTFVANDGTDDSPAATVEITVRADTDGDGIANDEDADDDGDGTPDELDAFPLDPAEDTDTDGDGVGDNGDAFPNDPTEDTDSDGDGTGNNADTDDDNDGTPDESDAFPLDPTEQSDLDGDGTGDNADLDDDGDGVEDLVDSCPTTPNADQADINADGYGDVCVDTGSDVSPSARLGYNPFVGAGSVIGKNALIGDNALIGENVSIGRETTIGDGFTIADGSSIGDYSWLGDDVFIGSETAVERWVILRDGAVLGDVAELAKYSEYGEGVSVGDRSSLGFFTRAGDDLSVGEDSMLGHFGTYGDGVAFGARVETGFFATIDSQVSVGDDVEIGFFVRIGSGTEIGDGVTIGGFVRIGENVTISDGASIPSGLQIPDNATVE